MKPFLLLLCLLTWPLLAGAQVSPSDTTQGPLNLVLDKRYGFLGNKFDTPITAFKSLVFIEKDGSRMVYRRAADIKSCGKARISKIHYKFYKGLLSDVQVFAPNDLENNAAWRELLKAAYGAAGDSALSSEPSNYGGTYFWMGRNAGINYSSYLGRRISINVFSLTAERKKKQADAAAVKKAAQRL